MKTPPASSVVDVRCWPVRLAFLLSIVMPCTGAEPTKATVPFHPRPVVDARGYVDVWALRRDVIAVEALTPITDEDHCSPEGDFDGPQMSRQQLQRQRREEKACYASAARESERFQKAKIAFNRAWLPKIKAAIAKGDAVAEVIFLLCETTDVLDRGEEVTTCNREKQTAAVARLRDIGFAAAYEPCDVSVVTWNRGFRFCTGRHDNWHTDAFRYLRLNRSRPLTPGYLTWGRELHYSGSAGIYDGRKLLDPPRDVKAARDLEIDRILRQEPRWSVFLLTRVGRHEWVPEGSHSTSGRLAPAWAGRYRLVRGSGNWTKPLQPMTGIADLRRVGDEFTITVKSDAKAPISDVADCRLRYSGGLTYLPQLTAAGQQSAQLTSLGYFYEGGGWMAGTFWDDGSVDAALAPLDPKKRYRQVLMQCDEGEDDQSPRLRFLILSGDTLLEFAADSPYGTRDLSVRHFRRIP